MSVIAQPAYADPLDAMKARDFLNKGNNHLTRLEFQQALDAYTECLLCDPNNRIAKENIVLTHNNWGIYWYSRNKFKEAREEWEQALKLNPNDRNARNNMQILNFRIKQLGLTEDGEKKVPPPSPAKPTGDFPPSQVIILTPGLKSGSTSGASATPSGGSGASAEAQSSSTPSDDPPNSGSGAIVILKNPKSSSATTSGGDASSDGGGSTSSSAGSSSPGISTYSSEGTGKFTTAPVSTPSTTSPSTYNSPSTYSSPSTPNQPPAATAGGSQEENIGDSLGLIEQKIYGRKQDSLPIMKRLEKLEIDTHGKTKSGTIKERIDTLRKSYGF